MSVCLCMRMCATVNLVVGINVHASPFLIFFVYASFLTRLSIAQAPMCTQLHVGLTRWDSIVVIRHVLLRAIGTRALANQLWARVRSAPFRGDAGAASTQYQSPMTFLPHTVDRCVRIHCFALMRFL